MCEKCARAIMEGMATAFAKATGMRQVTCGATGCLNIFVTNMPKPDEEPELCPPCGGRAPQVGVAN